MFIAGIILGAKSLRRIRQCPWLPGRGRSIAGIICSAIIGPLNLLAAGVFIVGGLTNPQLNMNSVQSGIRSQLDAQILQDDGFLSLIHI